MSGTVNNVNIAGSPSEAKGWSVAKREAVIELLIASGLAAEGGARAIGAKVSDIVLSLTSFGGATLLILAV